MIINHQNFKFGGTNRSEKLHPNGTDMCLCFSPKE